MKPHRTKRNPVGPEKFEVYDYTEGIHIIDCTSERGGEIRAERIATYRAFKTGHTCAVLKHMINKPFSINYLCWYDTDEKEFHAYYASRTSRNSEAIKQFIRCEEITGLHIILGE